MCDSIIASQYNNIPVQQCGNATVFGVHLGVQAVWFGGAAVFDSSTALTVMPAVVYAQHHNFFDLI